LLGSASDGSLTVRTPHRVEIMSTLSAAGAVVSSNGTDVLTVTGISAERVANLAADRRLPLYELTPHRASLEQAYLRLTRDAVEYSAGSRSPDGSREAR
jgi:ABC-2 type transport system ATP-binding protein